MLSRSILGPLVLYVLSLPSSYPDGKTHLRPMILPHLRRSVLFHTALVLQGGNTPTPSSTPSSITTYPWSTFVGPPSDLPSVHTRGTTPGKKECPWFLQRYPSRHRTSRKNSTTEGHENRGVIRRRVTTRPCLRDTWSRSGSIPEQRRTSQWLLDSECHPSYNTGKVSG